MVSLAINPKEHFSIMWPEPTLSDNRLKSSTKPVPKEDLIWNCLQFMVFQNDEETSKKLDFQNLFPKKPFQIFIYAIKSNYLIGLNFADA